ncbi:MAG: HU family DNA-binding protein [Polyangiaceae bacterium]
MATKKTAIKKPMTKTQLIQALSDATKGELSKREVKSFIESLTTIGHKQLKKTGTFTLPGFAKFRVVKKPATKARKGTNPFTGEEMMFKAKPASKAVRARPIKACKDAVG